MNGNIRKKILCVILAVAVLITTSCSTTGNLYAAELPQTQQEDQNLLETVQNTEDIADTENGAGTEDGLNTEDIADTEDTSNTGDTMDTESVADTEEDEEESEEEYAIESLLIEESDVIPSDHSLDVVYWNPNSQNSTSGTGQVLQYGGSDQNSGSTSKKPVLTLETALLRAAGNAVIYCMDYYGCSQNTAIDGNYYNVTIKRYTGYSGNILQITDGTLRLDNVTLDGSDSYADRVLTIGSNGKLEIGDSVGNVGNTFYFVESNANSVALVGTPESGTVYKVQFAAGYFNKAPVITEEGEEILLIDASASGLNPENYFNVLGLPDGWSVYLKDNTQIWARKVVIQEYTAIWLDGVNGNDSNSGRTSNECVKTWDRAYELYQSKLNGDGIIYIKGTVTVSAGNLTIQSSVVKRGDDFSGTMFQVTNVGSLSIGAGVSLEEEREDAEDYYAINSSGNLEISADAFVAEKILLTNRNCPLVLNGSGVNQYKIGAGGDFADGDLIVKNGVEPTVELVEGNFALREEDGDSYLRIPPIIYLNGAAGDDSRDGLTPETAVRTLDRAVIAALFSGTGSIAVFGGPAQIRNGETVILLGGMVLWGYGGYNGALLEITNGTLAADGQILGDVTLDDVGKMILSGKSASIEQNVMISIKGNAVMEMKQGSVKGSIIISGNGSATLTQENGEIEGNVEISASAGGFQQSGGTVTGTIRIKSGQVIMSGGTVTRKEINGETVMEGGIVLESGGNGSFVFQGGQLTKCNTAIQAMSGTVIMTGGNITGSSSGAIILGENSKMDISGGTINGNRTSNFHDIDVTGELTLSGTAVINDVIYLENSAHPLKIAAEIADHQVYYLDFSGEYVAQGGTETAVTGSTAIAATLDHFQLREGASHLLMLSENGNNLDITAEIDAGGIYLDGENGDDSNSGLDSSHAVKTFTKAKELLSEQKEQGNEYNIYICGQVTVSDTQTWTLKEFDWGPVVMRYMDYKEYMVYVRGKLILENITLDGNERVASNRPILYLAGFSEINDGTVICNNRNITAGANSYYSYSYNGGGIYSVGYLTINGGIIESNNAAYGGGIYNTGKLIINGGTIENNNATVDGGGIYNNSNFYSGRNNMIINGGSIESNSAVKHGGGIYNDYYANVYYKDYCIKIDGGTIKNNSAVDGGGIYNRSSASTDYCEYGLILNEGIIEGNKATNGGGIYNGYAGGLTIGDGGIIQRNNSDYGGGIYLSDKSNLELDGGTIQNNNASISGGGLYVLKESSTNGYAIKLMRGILADNYARFGNGMGIRGLVYGRETTKAEISLGSINTNEIIYLGQSYGTNNGYGIACLKLVSAPTDPSNKFYIEVDTTYAQPGMAVIIPDGDNVTNASQYLRNFQMKDNSGYTLVKDGNNIVLGQAYFVDGINGKDTNTGNTPGSAFKTVNQALSRLGNETGTIYVCGTIEIPSGTTETWTMLDGQSLTRYGGEIVNGASASSFTEDMIVIEDGAVLNLENTRIYGALGEDDTDGNGYLLVQGGTLNISADSSLEYGTVYLKDQKVIDVSGSSTELLMEVEKENPADGDIIGQYESASASHTANFLLSGQMAGFSLALDGDTVILEQAGAIYVNGINGNDSNNGFTPETAVRTMKQAYTKLSGKGGMIYVVNTVTLSENMTLAARKYTDQNGTITTSGNIFITRYETNQNPLFEVSGGTLTLSGIQISGSGQQITGNQSPLILIDSNAVLEVEKNAVLKNNTSVGMGGAIRNEGTVNLSACLFSGNTASKGSAIYQAGTLNIDSDKVNIGEEEIYFAAGAYVNIRAFLAADTVFNLNMDPSDTAEGRTIAVFYDDTYGTEGVAAQSGHFAINMRTTSKILVPKGIDTLVLAGDFDVTLLQQDFFKKIGDQITFNAVPQNASPAEVTVTVKKGNETIACTTKDYNRYKQITIPVTEENIGTFEVVFRFGKIEVSRSIIISGYEVIYKENQTSLIAAAQEDGQTGVHTDEAWVKVYNGAAETRSFQVTDYDIGYEDGTDVAIDNSKVSRYMESAMSYFGLEIAASTDIPANGSESVPVLFSNGDNLTESKAGSIVLENTVFGNNWASIDLAFETRAISRVQVRVNLDDEIFYDAKVSLKKADTGEVINLTAVRPTKEKENSIMSRVLAVFGTKSQTEEWPYQKTGIEEGDYRLYVNDMDTEKVLTVESGRVIQQEINLYTVTYELNEGYFGDDRGTEDIYIEGIGLRSLPIPERKEAKFAGWYEDENLTGMQVSQIDAQAGKSYTLYAAWILDPKLETVEIPKDQYFEPLNSEITLQAEIQGIFPEAVSVQLSQQNGNGETRDISADCVDSGNCKLITVPVNKENVGTITLTFKEKNKETPVIISKQIELSAYEIMYAEGKNSLEAAPQEDGQTGVHTDKAWIQIYNGASETRSFQVSNAEIRYEDGAEAVIDNSKISVSMEDAMHCFGLEIASATEIPANAVVSVPVLFSNGDNLTENKTGTITLANTVFGSCQANIDLAFETRAIFRAQVRVNLDDAICKDAKVSLENTDTGEIIELTAVTAPENQETNTLSRILEAVGAEKQAEEWIYQKTGIAEGNYKLYVNDMDTEKLLTVKSGRVVQQEINLYTVTYELNGGYFEDNREIEDIYVEGVGLNTLPIPKRSVMVFDGWYDNKNFRGEPVSRINGQSSRSYTLYAAWSVNFEFTGVELLQNQYFEPLNSNLIVQAEIQGVSPEAVSVQLSRQNENGETINISADCADSGTCKLITIPVSEENIGIITMVFSEEKAGTSKNITKEIELSAYEVIYAENRDYLNAASQEDGNPQIHTDRAEIKIYNGAPEARTFTPGNWEVSYTDEPDTTVIILSRMVEKNMSAEDAMKYFGMELEPDDKIEIPAKEMRVIQAEFFNGDLLTENKTGRILLKDARLGSIAADIPLNFKTQAITRAQVSLQLDDIFANRRNIELKDMEGNTRTLVNLQTEEQRKVHEIYNFLIGEEERNWNYQLTGIQTGRYEIFVEGTDTGRSIFVEEGKVSREKIRLYSISYELNGGTMSSDAPTYYIEGVGIGLKTPEKENTAFLGWYLSEKYEGETISGISETAAGALKLYAKWEEPAREEPKEEPVALVNEITNMMDPIVNEPVRKTAPQTSDQNRFFIDIAFVGGIACLSKMFLNILDESGMDEEEKERLIRKIIQNAKGKGFLARIGAIGLVLAVLMFYYTLGMKDEVRRLKKI